MTSRESALISDVLSVFREVHGNVPFTLAFVGAVAELPNRSVNGVCDFSTAPPAISIRIGLSHADMLDTLCHELAHLVCGLDAAHDSEWEACMNALSVRVAARHISGAHVG